MDAAGTPRTSIAALARDSVLLFRPMLGQISEHDQCASCGHIRLTIARDPPLRVGQSPKR